MRSGRSTNNNDGYLAPLEPELKRYYEALSRMMADISGPNPDIAGMRHAARKARLDLSPNGIGPNVSAYRGKALSGRLFRPAVSKAAPAGPLPLIIYLHGGGWTLLDTETHAPLMQAYADATGWLVLGLDYPLAPETQFPEMGRACESEVLNVAVTADRIGADPASIVLAGDSCGANLALSIAISLAGQLDGLCGLHLNYGVFDSDLTRPSYLTYGAAPYLLTREKMAFFWSSYCASDVDLTDPLAAPCRASAPALAVLPPVYLTVAGQDVLFDENQELADRLEAAGVATTMTIYPNAVHGFIEAVEHSPVARQAVMDAVVWYSGICEGGANDRGSSA